MEQNFSIKTKRDTSNDEDRSDAFDYFVDIKYEPLAIKQEPAEIVEAEDASVEINNIFIPKPEIDFNIKIEEIGNGLSGAKRKCDICGECFIKGLDLVTHRYAHTEDTYYTCCICNCNTFHLKPDLHLHILNVHFNLTVKLPISAKRKKPNRSNTTEKPYRCDICNKGFAYNSHLVVHNRIHSGEKPYECDVCHLRFAKSNGLTQHSLIHTDERPFECDVCHKTFKQKLYLTRHKHIHADEKPYKCDICQKQFAQSFSLTTHKRAHTGEKPYKCDVCNKRFASNNFLTVHNLIHSGEKSHQCDICHKWFRTKSNLKSHKRLHAGKKPFKRDTP